MATVLKHDRLEHTGEVSRPIAFNVEDVRTRAESYLAEIRLQANGMLEVARQQSDLIRQKAYQQGLDEAQAEIKRKIEERALQLSDERCKTATAACHKSLEELASETGKWLQCWRDATVDLATSMAERLVRASMAGHSETLRMWMDDALQLMRDTREIKILVHPDDFSIAGRYLQQMSKLVPQAADAEIIPDPGISPGGCIVRSKHGQIDQQLHSQLARLGEQLL